MLQPTVETEPSALSNPNPRAQQILAKTIYRELRQSGLGDEEIMGVASELLSHVAAGLRARQSPRT